MPIFGLKSTFLELCILAVQKRELIIEEVHIYYLRSARTGIDVNFYVSSIGLAVQSAYSIAGDARTREVGALKKLALNSKEATRFIIVTYEEENTIHEDGITIEVVPLYKFLLELEQGRDSTSQ